MTAREKVAQAAAKHLLVSGIGFVAALGVVKATFPSATADAEASNGASAAQAAARSGSDGKEGSGGPASSAIPGSKDQLQLVQVVFRCGTGSRVLLGACSRQHLGCGWADECGYGSWHGMAYLACGQPQPFRLPAA